MTADVVSLAERRAPLAETARAKLAAEKKAVERMRQRCFVLIRQLEQEEAEAAGIPEWNQHSAGETLIEYCARITLDAVQHFNHDEPHAALCCFQSITRNIEINLEKREKVRAALREQQRDERSKRRAECKRQREMRRMERELTAIEAAE